MTSPQVRIVRVTSSPRENSCCPGRSPQYNASLGFSSGVMQVICGVCTLLLGGIFFALVLHVIDTGAGVWCGAFIFIPTGVLGIFTKGKRTGLIIAYLVMCIISCFASLVMAAFIFYWTWYWGVECARPSTSCSNVTIYQAIQALIGILMVIDFVGAVMGAHVCCQVVPSSKPATRRNNAVHYERRQQPTSKKGPSSNRRF
ncbi:uncharacterized protein LOC121417710 [Lytechinus variegatus]|uniref:uncharacterized protein LOC121417710 n=2 Tax=Lytechinus variegatus TaxID=7654 RepID=UPI001BB101B2|nr:uncharacterized protein LOC121417710 [Lytechinus variegatus]